MYLTDIYIENNGPIDTLTLELPFTSEGDPRPVVLVGGNGSGKTNLLSIIADALFEAASQHFTDIVPLGEGMKRPWFRIAGATTVRIGATGSVSLLRFEHDGTAHFFKEKSGTVDPANVKERVPEKFGPQVAWNNDDALKEFQINGKAAAEIFETGVYTYFPSNRAEIPHWLNMNSLSGPAFNQNAKYTGSLQKPIYIEQTLAPLKQWLLALLIEVRTDVQVIVDPDNGQLSFVPTGNPLTSLPHIEVWTLVNHLLQTILGNQDMRLVWRGRRNAGLAIANTNGVVIPTLDALSAGQAILLGMFGTLIKYGDFSETGSTASSNITGICLVDEIDAHMHIDLQHKVLPALIKLFPKVQFIMSSHSPLFVLGLEQEFGAEGMQIIDMPSGATIQAESYVEFGRAFEVLQETETFNRTILKAAETPGKLLVLLEGETDPIYFRASIELLERKTLLDEVEFDWIGAKQAKDGQGFHTGKDALNATWNFLRANPGLMKRPVILLYDNDVNKTDEDFGSVFIRSLPLNEENTQATAGIENLLPLAALTPEMFITKNKKFSDGGSSLITTLDKMKLCNYLCVEKRDPEDFEGFSTVLDTVESLANSATPLLEKE